MDNKMKKPDLMMIIAEKMKNRPKKDNDDSNELAKMILDAVKDGNTENFARNLKNFIRISNSE